MARAVCLCVCVYLDYREVQTRHQQYKTCLGNALVNNDMYICVCTCLCVYMYVYMCTCVCTCMYMCTCVCICVHVCVHVCVVRLGTAQLTELVTI